MLTSSELVDDVMLPGSHWLAATSRGNSDVTTTHNIHGAAQFIAVCYSVSCWYNDAMSVVAMCSAVSRT